MSNSEQTELFLPELSTGEKIYKERFNGNPMVPCNRYYCPEFKHEWSFGYGCNVETCEKRV